IPQLPYPILKLKHYPLGRELAESIYYPCDEILVLEQGLPYIEQRLRGIMGVGTRIRGKLNRIVPADEPISLQVITNILNL
ncbi:MAG: indolepyruvate ferredoxin oxidoreductase, partial [Bacteroidales bacterium]